MTPVPSPAVEIRPFRNEDAAEVAAIFSYYVANTVISFETEPRSTDQWRDIARLLADSGWPFLIGIADGRVAGFAFVAPWRTKPAYRHTVESTVYLDPESIGRGYGRALMGGVLAGAAANGARQVVAVISDSGDPSSAKFHAALGFVTVGVLRDVGFKHGRWIDVALMQLSLTSAPELASCVPDNGL
jgi:phosphinothricin acetyltransferase